VADVASGEPLAGGNRYTDTATAGTDPGNHCIHFGATAILRDASQHAAIGNDHFNPEWWRRQGAAIGVANGRGKVHFVQAGEEVWAIRHNLRGGWMARISSDCYLWSGLERTRPWREWRVLRQLWDLGLPVPLPVAARVVRCGAFYRGDLITRRIEQTVTLGQVLHERPLPPEDWRRIGSLLRRFQEVGLRHDDINVSNLLVDAEGTFHLIDFDKACIAAPGAWCGHNLARFRRSLQKQLNRNPRFAFNDAAWDAVLESYADPSLEYAASPV
jgi:3-deoxy-D-manno-octulosonic acid kinase